MPLKVEGSSITLGEVISFIAIATPLWRCIACPSIIVRVAALRRLKALLYLILKWLQSVLTLVLVFCQGRRWFEFEVDLETKNYDQK